MLVTGDLVAAPLAYLLAFGLRVMVPFPFTQGYLPGIRFAEVTHHWPEMLAAQLLTLYLLGLYDTRALLNPRDHLAPIGAAAVLQALCLVAVYFFHQDLMFPRSIFLVYAAANAALVTGWRLACRPLMGRYPRRRVLVVGTSEAASEVIETVRTQPWLGMDVVGAVAMNGARPLLQGTAADVPIVGSRDELPTLCETHAVDEVIIVSEGTWQDRLLDALSRWPGERAQIYVVPSPYEILIGRREHLRLHDIPLIEVLHDAPAGGGAGPKRIFDAVLAFVLLAATAPVMALVALAVRMTSSGPVIYRQQRVGKDGDAFTIYKFRTMHAGAEEATGPVLAIANDPRITGTGRVLRATRLDELPQLWNVLRGDMSFVGPRPERPEFVQQYEQEIQGYRERFKVRPGLTGYAQVNGEYHTSPATKLKYDLAYMYNRSLWLDLKILSETAKVILTRRGV
ncbi:MAG TPA: sugar transferase [Candidatus Eisenbacteria bacterium]|nr:sugar transferase [Candidatus Eisenbacteria bacterium]